MIHYNFIGVLDLREVEEYPENVVLDSPQGVAIEYLVGKAGKEKGAARKPLQRNSKGTVFRLFLYIRVFSCVMNT